MKYIVSKQHGPNGLPVGTVVDSFSSDDMMYNDFAPVVVKTFEPIKAVSKMMYNSSETFEYKSLLDKICEEVEQKALYKYIEKEYL